MSDKKDKTIAEVNDAKNDKKAKKTSDAPKKENIFKRMWKSIKRFCKDFKGECKKINWPSGKTVLNSSLVVIVVAAITCLAIFAVDQGLAAIIKGLLGLARDNAATDVTEATKQMISMFFCA